MGAVAVRVVVGVLDRDEIEAPVPHSGLGGEARGKFAHGADGALQHGILEAILVIEVHVHGRDHEVVVRVLALGQPLREVACVVVVDIRKTGDTVAARRALLRFPVEMPADEVAYRFAAVFVAALRDQFVEGRGEIVVEGDGDALHAASLLHTDPPMRAAAVCVIVLLLAFVVAPPVLEATVLLAALHDAAHVLVFALVGALLCGLATPHRWGFLALLAMVALLGVGTELAQPYFAGAQAIEVASIGDVGRDLLGAVIGGLAWFAIRRRRLRWLVPAVVLLAVGLAPGAFVGWAYVQRGLHPQVVWDASRATWRVFLERTTDGELARLPGRSRARFIATGDSYAGISIREPPPDWRGFEALVVVLSNPGASPIALNVRIDDLPRDTEYEDRFNRERLIPAGSGLQWRIPVNEIAQGPRGRALDLSHITRVVVFLSPGSRGASFDIDSLRLERAP